MDKIDDGADVVLLIDTLGAGGAEMNFVHMANSFSRKGLKCKLVLCRSIGPLEKYVDSKVDVILLGCGKEIIFSIPKLIRLLRKERPKVIFSAFLQVNIAAIISTKVSRVGCKVFVSEHSVFSIANSKENIVSRRQFLFPFFAKVFYRFSSGIVAVSKAVQIDLASVTGIPLNRISVINNPVRLAAQEFSDLPQSAKIGRPFFQLVSCGRLTPVKDFYTLIKAVQNLRQKCDIRLNIIGDGSEKAKLEMFVDECGLREAVSFLGYIEDPFPYFKDADLFVLSSKYEGFGNVIVEAMSCGLPVVCTDCPGGPREILEDGRYGALVPVGNPSKMADAIEYSLYNPVDSGQLVLRANDFDIDLICDQYLSLFDFA